MLGLTKPRYFIDARRVRMQVQHGRLASDRRRAGERVHHRVGFPSRSPRTVLPGGHAGRGSRRRAVGRRVGRSSARPPGPRQRRHVHDRGDRRQADRDADRPAGDHHSHFVREGNATHVDGASSGSSARSAPGRPHQRIGLLKVQIRTGSRATSTSRRSADRWSSGSSSRSERGDTTPNGESRRATGGSAGPTRRRTSAPRPADQRTSPDRWSASPFSWWGRSRSSPDAPRRTADRLVARRGDPWFGTGRWLCPSSWSGPGCISRTGSGAAGGWPARSRSSSRCSRSWA